MSGIKNIDYMNKSILFIDLEGSASDYEVVDLGEKAKKLVKLRHRNEIFVLYNLTGVVFTKHLMQNMKRLMEHAPLVTRRVMFGVDPKFAGLLQQLLQSLQMNGNTRFAEGYPQALNLLVNDSEWPGR